MSLSQSKSLLVILDAGVVIEAFRTNSWSALINKYAIVLSRIVAGESFFFKDDNGKLVTIDLKPYEANGSITIIDIKVGELDKFRSRFDFGYAERLHAGELESLCYLLKHAGKDAKICSGDSIVYKVLGKLRISDQGISMEELLGNIGFSKPLAEKFSKRFRERWSREGFSDSFQ